MSLSLARFGTLVNVVLRRNCGRFAESTNWPPKRPVFWHFSAQNCDRERSWRRSALACMWLRDTRNKANSIGYIYQALIESNGDQHGGYGRAETCGTGRGLA